MLYMPNTILFDTEEAVLSKNAVITAEGQALVATPDGLKQSAGTEGEIFAGFVCQRVSAAPFLEDFYTKVEDLTVATAGSVTLTKAPISAEVVGLYDLDKGEAITEASATVDGKEVKSEKLTEGLNVRVTYKYALTVVEAKSIMGDAQPGGPGGQLVGQIGVVTRGTVFTNCYDSSVDWSAEKLNIVLGKDGIITTKEKNSTGVAINAYVVANGIPSTTYPFLGLKFSAA